MASVCLSPAEYSDSNNKTGTKSKGALSMGIFIVKLRKMFPSYN